MTDKKLRWTLKFLNLLCHVLYPASKPQALLTLQKGCKYMVLGCGTSQTMLRSVSSGIAVPNASLKAWEQNT
eukprot:scaffold25585_cov131-Skeletonema_marinoi.AAC.1